MIAYNKMQSLENLKSKLSNGVLRNVSGAFAAHYSLAYDEAEGWTVKISSFEGNTLKHYSYKMTLDIEDDEKAQLKIEGGVSLQGSNLKALYYEYATGKMGTDTALSIDLNKASDMVNFYNGGGWGTHIIDVNTICDALQGYTIQLEMDNRDPRNLVACPGSYNGNQFHYVFFQVTPSFNDNDGKIYLKNSDRQEPFGGYGNDIANAAAYLSGLLEFMFQKEGLWMYQDGEYLYAINPSNDLWVRMK